jgi:hypothetical protein
MRIRTFTPLFTFVFLQSAQSQCYYPGANAVAPNHYPCDGYAVTSLCCPTGWACFSNKLCVVTDANAVNRTVATGTTIRGTCTNPRWNSTVCGDFCLSELQPSVRRLLRTTPGRRLTIASIADEPVNDNDGTLVPCGNNVFACKPEAENGLANCAAGKNVFSLTQGSLQTVIGQSTIGSTFTASVPVSSTASTTTRPPTSNSDASSSSTSTSAPAEHKSKSKAGKIAGSVIGGLAFISIVIGLCLWCFPKRVRRTAATTNVPLSNHTSPYYNNGNGDANTFASETSTLAPFPHPYSPPASPPPQMSRSQVQVFGQLGVREDDPYQKALTPPQGYNVPRRAVREMSG